MICPNLLISTHSNLNFKCISTAEISEVKTGTVNQYCATDQHEQCPSYHKRKAGIQDEIHYEVYRAIG
jgi:hypothetical protein